MILFNEDLKNNNLANHLSILEYRYILHITRMNIIFTINDCE